MTWAGKVALIVGASSGIGRATALAFAAAGVSVMLASRREAPLCELAQVIHASNGKAAYQLTDVTNAKDVQRLVDQTLALYHRLDFACNAAGITRTGPLTQLTEEDWERVMDVNLKGTWLCLKYEVAAMLATGGGSIVNIASVGGLVGTAKNSIYAASKGGVIALSRALAMEYITSNIRVNVISPGAVETEMFVSLSQEARQRLIARHPIGRIGMPEEIAHAVLWLCSDQASFIVGQNMVLDGGVTAQ